MKRPAGLIALAAAALAACAAPAVVLVSADYDAARVKRVALVGFDDFPGAAGSGEIAASAFEKYLLLPGYALVERRQIDDVLKEHGLAASGLVDSSRLKGFAQVLGVDALVIGTITDFAGQSEQTVMMDVPQEQVDPVYGQIVTTAHAGGVRTTTVQNVVTGYATTQSDAVVPETEFVPARVGLSARLVDARTGEILWSASAASDGASLSSAVESAAAKTMRAVADRLKKLAPRQ